MIAIIGVLVALLLPAVQAAREAARRSQCAKVIDGAPAANASVAFHPLSDEASGQCSVARTDRDGRFTLTTYANADGAPAGEYAVTVVWIDETIPFDECNCDNPLIHDRLKGYYADREFTELRASVHQGANALRLFARRPPASFAPLQPPQHRSQRS